MKKLKLILILGFISVLTSLTYAQSNNELDLKKLLQEFQLNTENWRQTYNSNDAQNLVPLYTEDADYISSHVLGLEAIGRNRLIANFQNGMNMGGHIDSIEILKMNVSCDIATLLCKYTATNSSVTVTGRNLLVMKKINGKWFISLHMTVV